MKKLTRSLVVLLMAGTGAIGVSSSAEALHGPSGCWVSRGSTHFQGGCRRGPGSAFITGTCWRRGKGSINVSSRIKTMPASLETLCPLYYQTVRYSEQIHYWRPR